MANHCDFYEYKSSFFQVDIGVSLRIKKYPQMYISNFASMLLPQKLSVQKKRQFVRLFFDNRMCSGEKFTG